MPPTPFSRPWRDSASTLRSGVCVTSRSWKAGHRRARISSLPNTGNPDSAASRHGPLPTVNCSRSAVVAASPLAASGVRRPGSPCRLSPTPSTGSTAAAARDSRTGSRSGSPSDAPAPASSASRKRMAMSTAGPSTCPAHAAPPDRADARLRSLPAPAVPQPTLDRAGGRSRAGETARRAEDSGLPSCTSRRLAVGSTHQRQR